MQNQLNRLSFHYLNKRKEEPFIEFCCQFFLLARLLKFSHKMLRMIRFVITLSAYVIPVCG